MLKGQSPKFFRGFFYASSHGDWLRMNNETAPILDILEELKQECKAIKKSQAELRTALVEQQNTKPQDATKVPKAVHLQLSQETKAKIRLKGQICS